MVVIAFLFLQFNFSGEGQQATSFFEIQPGTYRIETYNTGPGEVFVCQLIRTDQREMPAYITTYPDQSGSAVFVIELAGEYYLNIVAGGRWKVVIERME